MKGAFLGGYDYNTIKTTCKWGNSQNMGLKVTDSEEFRAIANLWLERDMRTGDMPCAMSRLRDYCLGSFLFENTSHFDG